MPRLQPKADKYTQIPASLRAKALWSNKGQGSGLSTGSIIPTMIDLVKKLGFGLLGFKGLGVLQLGWNHYLYFC